MFTLTSILKASAHHTAILLFTRTAEAESRIKALDTDQQKNRRLTRLLINHSLHTARQSGIDVIVTNQSQQQGDNFGQRLWHAFHQVFNSGYEHVIAIGNDTPGVTAGDYKHASRLLRQHGTVLGPACDGGVYLIGFSKQVFYSLSFSEIAWQTASVCEQLEELIFQQGHSVCLLSPKQDIDKAADIKHVIGAIEHALVLAIRSILRTPASSGPQYYHPQSERIFIRGMRAPPTYA